MLYNNNLWMAFYNKIEKFGEDDRYEKLVDCLEPTAQEETSSLYPRKRKVIFYLSRSPSWVRQNP